MKITIERATPENIGDIGKCNGVFTVDSKLILNIINDEINYRIVEAPRYEKRYADEGIDYATYLNNAKKVIFLAYVGDQIAGRIILRKNWNQYTYIEDIAVDIKFRKMGIGKKLISEAKKWNLENKLKGIMLETQNNNVGACKFYEKCGFHLGGFDKNLYKGLHEGTAEIALYWYYMIDS